MPSEQDHLELANRNHGAMVHLSSAPPQYAEWIATTAFYKAVQVVEAMLTNDGRPTQDHSSRHETLKRLYPDIWKHYRPLWQASCVARYLHDNHAGSSYTRFSDYIDPVDIEKKIIRKRLRPVEQLVYSKLSADGRALLQRVPSD